MRKRNSEFVIAEIASGSRAEIAIEVLPHKYPNSHSAMAVMSRLLHPQSGKLNFKPAQLDFHFSLRKFATTGGRQDRYLFILRTTKELDWKVVSERDWRMAVNTRASQLASAVGVHTYQLIYSPCQVELWKKISEPKSDTPARAKKKTRKRK